MAMRPWQPFEEMTPLREAMNRLIEESFIGPRPLEGLGRSFPVDVRETDYILEASLPGMKPKDIQVNAVGNTVTIRASTKREEKTGKAGTYVRQERHEGEGVRTIMLPGPIDREHIAARNQHGELTVTVPKTEETKSKSVTVQVKGVGSAH